METLYSPATVAKLIKEHDFRFVKSLGQNFLVDGNIVNKIIELGDIGPEDFVIEIGTGLGVLTKAMAEKGAQVHTVEIDHRLFSILEETLKDAGNVVLHKGDFLKMELRDIVGKASADWASTDGQGRKVFGVREAGVADGGEGCGALVGRKSGANLQSVSAEGEDRKSGANLQSAEKRPVKIMGNLPYYISSPIIMKVLEENERDKLGVSDLTIMVQKEVGQRLSAEPGGKDYGILSIAVQYYTTVSSTMVVAKNVFMPKPAVDSMVLNLKMRQEPPVELESVDDFFRLVKKAFSQRRKTLVNCLAGFDGLDKMEVSGLLLEAGIDGGRRPETFTITEFGTISNIVGQKVPGPKTEAAGRKR